MSRRAGVILVAVLALPASADPGADRATSEAQAKAASGDYIGAAAKYREAFAADPRAELMCNVGVAYYKAKDLPRAHRYLNQCLAIGTSLDRNFIGSVKTVLAAVETTLGSTDFTPVDLLVQPATATTTVDGGVPFDEPIVGSRRVWFPYGRYRLIVHAEGHVDHVFDITATDRKPIAARVALPRAPSEPPPSDGSATEGVSPGEGSGSAAIVAAPPPPPPPPMTAAVTADKPSIVPPLAATIASAGVGAAALLVYIAARDSAADASNAATHAEHKKLEEQAYERRNISWVLAGATGVGAAISGYLWVRRASSPRLEVQATGSGGAVTLTGRW